MGSTLPFSYKEVVLENRTKYNVDKKTARRTYNGIVFDSELEMKYYRDVILPQVGSGSIVDYELQKSYELQSKFVHGEDTVRPIIYVADFWIKFADEHEEVIDIKGMPDATAKLKRKLFWYKYPDIDYYWVCYSRIDGGWCRYEDVQKARAERRKQRKGKKEK